MKTVKGHTVRAAVWSELVLAVGIVVVILASFSMGLGYLEGKPTGSLLGVSGIALCIGISFLLLGLGTNARLRSAFVRYLRLT